MVYTHLANSEVVRNLDCLFISPRKEMAPRLTSLERIQHRNEAMRRWKLKNWDKYVEQKRRLGATPEYLAKRRARYAESVQRVIRSEEDVLERRRHLSKLCSREYRQREREKRDNHHPPDESTEVRSPPHEIKSISTINS